MSQHAIEAGSESDGSWIPLIEYSVRSGISTSTIRRKIKSNSIQFKLENGRYLILYQNSKKPAPAAYSEMPKAAPAPVERKSESQPEVTAQASAKPTTQTAAKESVNSRVIPLIDRSVQMVTEAYEKALTEKDERIRLLSDQAKEMRDRLEELRTLVAALEEKYQVRY